MIEPTEVRLSHWLFLTDESYQQDVMAWFDTRADDEQAVLIFVHELDERCCRLLADLRARYVGSSG